MGCSCGSGTSSSGYRVLSPNGNITTWRTETEADAAAARTGGKRIP